MGGAHAMRSEEERAQRQANVHVGNWGVVRMGSTALRHWAGSLGQAGSIMPGFWGPSPDRLIHSSASHRSCPLTEATTATVTPACCAEWAAACSAATAAPPHTTCAAWVRWPSPSPRASGCAPSAAWVAEVS